MTAILLGSISTVADTSELQRDAFNRAFAEHGLDWRWDREEYASLLTGNGGRARIAEYAERAGVEVDAEAVHATKSELFQQALATEEVRPRPGVVETIGHARDRGVKVALVTTTAGANLEALGRAVADVLDLGDLDLVLDTDAVEQTKPDGEVYRVALERLGEQPEGCVAIEDNVGGAAAASGAGIACVAFPNANTAGHDFSDAVAHCDKLVLDDLLGLLEARK